MNVCGKKYRVLRLLGKGKGGYSYLCRLGDQPVVVKQIHHEPCAYYTFGDKLASELRDYERLQAAGIPLPRMLEVDHAAERIVKEYVCGPVIYDLALQDAPETECQEWGNLVLHAGSPKGFCCSYVDKCV